MSWQLVGAYLTLFAGVAFAEPLERLVNVLPNGNVQLERDGQELNLRQFRQALLRMKKETPQLMFHLSVKSEEAFRREKSVVDQIKAAGFDIHHIKVD